MTGRIDIRRRRLLTAVPALLLDYGCRTPKPPMIDIHSLIESRARELKFTFGPCDWELVRIEPGEFMMGSPAGERGREDGEVPPTRVRITQPFYLGRYAVTQRQWRAIMKDNPSEFEGDDLAVDQIAYRQAHEFCRRLAKALGVQVTLPTESEWEYACRAGTTTRFYSGDADAALGAIAWFRDNAGDQVHPVGQKQPNAWGLFDMLGNVYEPCIDYIGSFDALAENDPEGPRLPDQGAMRGGAWMEPAERCRAAVRLKTTDRFGGMGIRIAIKV
jgi:formylglycine-generating enzyme required for sulfatase activity